MGGGTLCQAGDCLLTHRFKATKCYQMQEGAEGADMRTALAMVFLMCLMAGCVTSESPYIDTTLAGRGADQLRTDRAACDVALRQSPVGQAADQGPSVGITLTNIGDRKNAQNDFIGSCMASRGWER